MNQTSTLPINQLNAAIDQEMIDPRALQLESLRIRPGDTFEVPQVMWSLLNTDGKYGILGTSGNFSLVIGRAKAKKTFFITMALSMVVSSELLQGRFKGNLLPNANRVLYFDTEQSKHTVWRSVDRICKQINHSNPKNLDVFGLRSKNPSERLDLIEYAIYNTDNLGFVVIDGARDLITSINDEEQATMLSSKLLKWTEEKNIHVITVLHQNKGDNNARGHLGTELINKAETVLSVTKSEDNPLVSIVAPEQCRNVEPEPFAFEINDDGLPVIVDGYTETMKSTKSFKPRNERMNDIEAYRMLANIFSRSKAYKFSDLISQLSVEHEVITGKSIGANAAGKLKTLYENKGWIIKGEGRECYSLGEFVTTL